MDAHLTVTTLNRPAPYDDWPQNYYVMLCSGIMTAGCICGGLVHSHGTFNTLYNVSKCVVMMDMA